MKRVCSFLCTAAFLSFAAITGAADSREIAILSARGEHNRIVQELSKHVWTRSSEPQLLITFCESQFAIGDKRFGCVLDPKSADQAREFAGAVEDMKVGQTKKAKHVFEKLAHNQAWFDWGNAGLIELAWYTENIQALGLILDRFDKNSKKSRALSESLGRYRLLHAEANCDWESIEKTARRYTLREIAQNPPLFASYARALFITGQKETLGELLEEAAPVLQQSTEYMFSSADYALLSMGIQGSVDVLKKYAGQYPRNEDLLLQRAYVDVLHTSPKVAAPALAALHKVAGASRRDVGRVLAIAVTLARYHKPDESLAVFRLIDRESTSVEDFAMFHTLMAWYAVYRGDLGEAKAALGQTLGMAPRQPSANWLRALIALRQDDAESGTIALKNLFDSDPYDENNASLILRFRGRFRTSALEQMFQAMLVREKYYGEEMRRRIRDAQRGKG
jgi:hypothetical protein